MGVSMRANILPRFCLLLASLAFLSGCVAAPRWVAQRSVSPELVARTLDEPEAVHEDIRPEDIQQIPVRQNLRPCCAFGTHLRASLGSLPVPFFSIGNILAVDQLGPHKYDSGAFSARGSSEENMFTKENNGLVYTCRGGFVDTAHVRDYADWTLFWAATIARSSVSGATIELPPEGGKRRVIIRPLPAELVEVYGLRRTVVAMAQWLAFQMSIWHELATAYGWASIDFYPEYVSAFSPEDLYSNLLGIKIAGGLLLRTGSAATDSVYDRNMDVWLQATLKYLAPVSAEAAQEAMYLVDGIWWDSKARLPNPRLVLRRNLDAGMEIVPWVVLRAYSSSEMHAWIARQCAGNEQPLVLRRQESLRGVKF